MLFLRNMNIRGGEKPAIFDRMGGDIGRVVSRPWATTTHRAPPHISPTPTFF